jgi:hypothetical protein
MKLMLIVELDAESEREARAQLDAFREAVLPSSHGLTIYRATQEDLRESGACQQVPRTGPIHARFITPWDA